MPYAKADGATIHYTVQGEGRTTLLLVMGLGEHASEWGEAFPRLLAQGHRVVCMDNRGIGESTTERTSWTMQDMAKDASAVLDALDVSRAHVLGLSMGGMIAQTLAIEHPGRVQKLVLMSTAFGGPESVGPEPEAAALFAPAPGVSPAELRRRALQVITAKGFAERNRELVEQLVVLRERAPTPPQTFLAQLDAIFLSDRSQLVRGIEHPVLVIHGTEDSLIPVQNGELLAERIPNARLLLLPRCGHLPHCEKPDESASAVLSFLEEA